jgi:hypothetical protein
MLAFVTKKTVFIRDFELSIGAIHGSKIVYKQFPRENQPT